MDEPHEPLVVTLARRQLEAYNRADLDAFCGCYHADIEVLDATGECTLRGADAFRGRYAAMFAAHAEVHGAVEARLVLGAHVVEHEVWSRRSRDTGERTSGEVLVRYTAHEGTIRWAEFLR